MLSPGRYLLGAAEICLLIGFAGLGASALRSRLLPRLAGAPAHLASTVLALALLLWSAELLGAFGALKPIPYLALMGLVGIGVWARARWRHGGRCRERKPRPQAPSPVPPAAPSLDAPTTGPAGAALGPSVVSLAIAAVALIHFAAGAKTRLSTGMTGFDSTWYHGPFAAGNSRFHRSDPSAKARA